MEIKELEKRLNNNKLDSLYFLYGEEIFLLEQCLKKIKKLFGEKIDGINYIKLDNTNIDTLIQNLEVPAFGYEKKLIIAKDTGLFAKAKKRKSKKGKANSDDSEKDEEEEKKKDKSEKIAKYIEENIKEIAESNILIFIEKEADNNALYKVIEKNGILCDFKLLKNEELIPRIVTLASTYGVKIDNYTANYFIESCGQNMQVLINELRKQIEYAGKGGVITKDAIDDLATKQIEGYIFDLTDSLGNHNLKKALAVYEDLIYLKEPIQLIMATLYNHFKRLYFTKLALKEKRPVARAIGLTEKQAFLEKKYIAQVKYFDEYILRRLLQELIELDYKYKTGAIDFDIGIEAILCRYCSK